MDGVDVIVTRGAPPSTESMLKQLEEVKNLFEEKFGHSVDQEIMNKGGMDVIVTRGAPPSAESMLKQLEEVKELYEKKFGHSVDQEIADLEVVNSDDATRRAP